MNAEEAAQLCLLAKTLSPAQAVEEFTPQAWALVLKRWRFEDAKEALAELGGEQQYVHVSHIVARIKRIRSKRIHDFGPVDPPTGLDPADTGAYSRWIAGINTAIADGTYRRSEPPAVASIRRDVIRELGHVGQPIDSIEAAKPLRAAHEAAVFAKQEAEAARETKRREKTARLEHMRAEDRAARDTARETATALTEGA